MSTYSPVEKLNRFTVQRIEQRGEQPLLIGRLSKPGQPSAGLDMSLFKGLHELVEGELTELNPDTATGVFAVSSGELHPSIVPGTSLPIIDRYWSYRLYLILDTSLQWARQRFGPTDAFEQPSPQGGRMWRQAKPDDQQRSDGRLVAGGWDHEHCELCWQKIGISGQPDGCVSKNDLWVCVGCYKSFIEPQDLGFVEGKWPIAEPSSDEQVHDQINDLIDVYDLKGLSAFVEGGANVDARTRYGGTPLMVAASRGHLSLLSLLLKLGADVNAESQHGYTALASAAQAGCYEAAKLLIDAGARTRVPSRLCSGSLLNYVKTGRGGGDPRIVNLLTKATATD